MRLFFALWPDEAAAAALAGIAIDLASRSGGKAVPSGKIHLTLAFLGETGAEELARAREAADGLAGPPFEVVIDQVGSFRGAKVAWVGWRQPGAGLVDLQSRLAESLRQRDFRLDERPFTPHLTVARKIQRSIGRASMAAIAWRARELALVGSETGTGRYTTLYRWAFVNDKSP